VEVVGTTDNDDFDCSHGEWVEQLRADVRCAADEGVAHGPSPTAKLSNDPLLAARIKRAKTVGLEDGTRIEARDDGWVVIDSFYSYLVDPEDAAWVAGDNDEDMPPAIFPSAEAAYRAWERSEETSAARMQRREEALKRLGMKESQ
jgi:hypothetical protein